MWPQSDGATVHTAGTTMVLLNALTICKDNFISRCLQKLENCPVSFVIVKLAEYIFVKHYGKSKSEIFVHLSFSLLYVEKVYSSVFIREPSVSFKIDRI